VPDLRERSRTGLAVGAVLAALLLLPLLGPGYVLVRDMAFVPRTPLGGQLLGLDGVPRGVPSELLIALASRVVATGWLQDVVLVGLVVGGAWGAARLAPTTSRVGAALAAASYGWSPYLHERLLLGQWALLLGWAVLPWAVRASLDWRRGAPGWAALAALSVSALGGANSLLLVSLAVVVCGRPVKALGAVAVLSVPWALPGLLQDQVAGDPRGVVAFAASSDSPLGVVASLLTGGGVWAREAVPAGRSAGSWIALALLLLALTGLPLLRARLGDRFVAAGLLGLLLSLLGTVPLLDRALRWAVVHVPASGLLRDGQKWVAPLALVVSAALACAVERLPANRLLAVVLVVAPVAALPGAAWAEGGDLTVSHYPSDWSRVTRQAEGPVLVLPWTLYRAFPWDDGTTVLDPATKLLQRPVVNDALPLPGTAVRGEDPVAARLDPAVKAGDRLLPALRREGIRQVLVEQTTAGYDAQLAARQTQGLKVVVRTPELTLYAVPGSGPVPSQVTAWPVVTADLVVAACVLAVLLLAAGTRRSGSDYAPRTAEKP
jgi:hypothetical protein